MTASFREWLLVESGKLPPIRTPSLSYDVTDEGDNVRKTPKPGFGFFPKMDLRVIKALGDLCPPTEYDAATNSLVQRRIEGRFASPDELRRVIGMVESKGFTPRGLLEHDVIIDADGRPWVVDVGHFEVKSV